MGAAVAIQAEGAAPTILGKSAGAGAAGAADEFAGVWVIGDTVDRSRSNLALVCSPVIYSIIHCK
jgi:hypothetical protein